MRARMLLDDTHGVPARINFKLREEIAEEIWAGRLMQNFRAIADWTPRRLDRLRLPAGTSVVAASARVADNFPA